VRLYDILNVLFFGFVRGCGRNIIGDGFSRLLAADGAEREQDGGNHKARFLRLERANEHICVPLVGKGA